MSPRIPGGIFGPNARAIMNYNKKHPNSPVAQGEPLNIEIKDRKILLPILRQESKKEPKVEQTSPSP